MLGSKDIVTYMHDKVFGHVGLVSLFVWLQNSQRICMKVLPEVCPRPRSNPFKFGDYPDYDPHPDPH